MSSLFSAAEAYERFMGRWSSAIAPFLVRFALVRDGDAVLDVGSGTGSLAAAIVEAAPASRIVGIDPTEPYVKYAQSKHARHGRVTFEIGDARRLRFSDRSFDRALSLLAFNFIPDAKQAAGEMKRVTKPEGTVTAAVWDYGDSMEMLRIFWDESIGMQPASDGKDERHMPLCRSGELAELWRETGLRDVAEEALTIETRFTSFDDYWAPFQVKQGPAGAFVASLSETDRDNLRVRLRRRLLGDEPDRPIVLRARAWAARGTVP
jgi:SAM-dependent methyltransferase